MHSGQNPVIVTVDFRNGRRSAAPAMPDRPALPADAAPARADVLATDLVALAARLEAEMRTMGEALEMLNKALASVDPDRLFRSARRLADATAEAHLPTLS